MEQKSIMFKKRLRKGLSLRQLGEILEVTPATLGQIERKKSRPRLDIAIKIADYLEMDVRDLL